jgi:hypothetical protein
MSVSKTLTIAVAVVLVIGAVLLSLTSWFDTTVPREADLAKQPELAPFLIGRKGFRGIEFNIDTSHYSFAYPTSVPKSDALFEQVRAGAEKEGWSLISGNGTQQSYVRKSGAHSAPGEFDKVTISYDAGKHEVTVVRERTNRQTGKK